MIDAPRFRRSRAGSVLLFATMAAFAPSALAAQTSSERPDFERLKAEGALRSRYRAHASTPGAETAPEPGLAVFRRDIEPILARACHRCHGPDKQKGRVRIDTQDPDLFAGSDVERWLDVLTVLTNGEMPPAGEPELAGEERGRVIEWLAGEVQRASSARRAGSEHSSFRRLSNYEYDYALQDLLGLPFRFAANLPPDPTSAEGFQNSSEVLHLTAMRLRAYLESAREALRLATVRGERPAALHWAVSMEAAAAAEWARQDARLEELRKRLADDPGKLEEELARLTVHFRARPNGTHYEDLSTGRTAAQTWTYDEARYAWKPTTERTEPPERTGHPERSDHVAVVPRGAGLVVELGDRIPERGTLRVRVRASRASAAGGPPPSLRLVFGWQASNDSHASVTVSAGDTVVEAPPEAPELYTWDVPLSQVYPRNSVRHVSQLGDLPSPSEYVRLVNASLSGDDLFVHHVEVMAPVFERWPPASHARIFLESANAADEDTYAREVLANFMSRAWRREASAAELERKLELFGRLRPEFESFEDAMVEVLATVLSSPNFLYVVVRADRSDLDLATRLSLFLWCSTPDDELLAVAAAGRLEAPEDLTHQVARMLADPRSRRFSEHFARQWLGLPLLDLLHVDLEVYPHFDADLKEALREEPVAFFHEVLRNDQSVLEFLHSGFTMANERLARHYGLSGVFGNHFRRVELEEHLLRGGVLAQAGILAMNSDGKDSHPLKRGIWMLENLLNDPPPPPPPAVPVIDLTDPEIARLTLKERIENHRDDPACMSCHAKIDPWGIAFENFDAVGSWRAEVQGRPVDARSVLFNEQELDGIDGLKRFLLENRQDQFVRALVEKLATYALGRPLTFADRARIDDLTGEVRARGDGLATMIERIATSDLFRSR